MEYCLNMNPDPAERRRIRLALEAGRDPGRGVYLPRYEDFERLREYMGALPETERGYTPYVKGSLDQTVLPNLVANVNESPSYAYDNYFWTSSVNRDASSIATAFDGREGVIFYTGRVSSAVGAFRCVARRR